MKIKTLDRPVLTVSDIELSIDLHTQILDTREISFGQDRKALSLKGHKRNFHQIGMEFQQKAGNLAAEDRRGLTKELVGKTVHFLRLILLN